MFRALFELLIMFAVVMVARAVLTSLMRGFFNASNSGFRAQGGGAAAAGKGKGPQADAVPTAGELHKDPVCGTYIAARPELRRQIGDQTFYYCSEACREKHAMAAR